MQEAPLTPSSAWKSFVSPSLFTSALDSPSGTSSGTLKHSSSLHEREINPFSDAFGQQPSTDNGPGSTPGGGSATRGKRALGHGHYDADDMALADTKRPKLRVAPAREANAPSLEVPTRTDSNSTSEASSSSNSFSFEDSGSSESKDASESPASSIAPSPKPQNLFEKLNHAHAQQAQHQQHQQHQQQQQHAPSNGFHHYQPAPLPMRYGKNAAAPPPPPIMPPPSAECYSMPVETTVAPSATMPASYVPLDAGAVDMMDPRVSAYEQSHMGMVPYPPSGLAPVSMPGMPVAPLMHLEAPVAPPSSVRLPSSRPSSSSAPTVRAPINGPSSVVGPGSTSMAVSDRSNAGPSPSATSANGSPHEHNMMPPRKRGRKPKVPDPNAVSVDPEIEKAAALERNRIAASKSRMRKKERVHNLERTAAELSQANAALQSTCHALQQELASLRALLSTKHPSGSCSCTHVQGYMHREAEGGGIPAIERIAGDTLSRRYSQTIEQYDADTPPNMAVDEGAVLAQIEAQQRYMMHQPDSVESPPSGRGARRGRSASTAQYPQPSAVAIEAGMTVAERHTQISKNAIPIRRSSRV